MDDDLLITLVEEQELIYNKYHLEHRLPGRKAEVWRNIALEMGASAEECVHRWNTLKDRYRRYCRLVQTANKAEIFKWERNKVFYDGMSFLKPYLTQRLTRRPNLLSSLSQSSNASQSSRPQSPVVKISISPVMISEAQPSSPLFQEESFPESPLLSSPVPSPEELIEQSPEPEPSPTPSPEPTPLPTPVQVRIPRESAHKPTSSSAQSKSNERKNWVADDNKTFDEAMRMLKSVFRPPEATQRGDPAIEGFRNMIITTISGLSERNQAKAMQKVTEVVMAIKLEPDN